MAQGFNLDSIDPAFVMEILQGLEGTEDPVAEEVFDFEPVDEMSGDIPFLESKYTLVSDDATELSKVAFDDEPQTQDQNLSKVTFQFTGKYAEMAEVHETDVETMSRIETDEDLVEALGRIVMMKISGAFDIDVKDVLQSTTLNDTVSASTAWTNQSTADPLSDLDSAVDTVGSPDILWLGLDKARDLAATDAMKAEVKQYQATNARARMQDLADELISRYQLREVVIDGTQYNQNGQGQSLSSDQIYDGTVWVGNSDHFVVVEREELERAGSDFTEKTGMYEVYAQKYLDIARAESSQGVAITGT